MIWITSICLASVAVVAAGGIEPKDPPPTTQPAASLTLRTNAGQALARIRIDPRGLSSLRLADEPELDWVIPRKDHAWDYREWHWWKGQPWGDMMRPRYWARSKVYLDDLSQGYAWLQYSVDGFDCMQQFFFPDHTQPKVVQWDLVTTIRNITGYDVEGYGQFFACYTPVNGRNSHWLWLDEARLVTWHELGVSHLDGFVYSPQSWFRSEKKLPYWPRDTGKLVGTWHQPVLVSHASKSGWRSVILIEEAYCAALTQGKEGDAMDYILYPGHTSRLFSQGAAFSVHIRHHLWHAPDLPNTNQLETLWNTFESSHEAIRNRAQRRRERAKVGSE